MRLLRRDGGDKVRIKSHLVAKLFYLAWRDHETEKKIRSLVCGANEKIDKLLIARSRFFLAMVEKLDERVPCPHCKRSTPVVEIEDLKTYCWECSYWGAPPVHGAEGEEKCTK